MSKREAAKVRRRLDEYEAGVAERLQQRGEPAPQASARLLRRLAACAALPVLFNAEFVHLLRLNFFSLPPGQLSYRAESDLLLSGLCRLVDERYYEIDPDLRQALLVELAAEPGDLLRRTATLLWEYTERCRPWGEAERLERAQRLTALNFLDPERALEWRQLAGRAAGRSGQVERDWLVAMDREIKAAAPVQRALKDKATGRPAQNALLVSIGRDPGEVQDFSRMLVDGLGLKLDLVQAAATHSLDDVQAAVQQSLAHAAPDSSWLFAYLGWTVPADGETALRPISDSQAHLPLSWIARAFVHSPASHALVVLADGFFGFSPGLETELQRSGEHKTLSVLAPAAQRLTGPSEQDVFIQALLHLLNGLGLAHDDEGVITTSTLAVALEAAAKRLSKPAFTPVMETLRLNRAAGEFTLRLPAFLEPETLRLAANPNPDARSAALERLLAEDLPKHLERRPLALALARARLQPSVTSASSGSAFHISQQLLHELTQTLAQVPGLQSPEGRDAWLTRLPPSFTYTLSRSASTVVDLTQIIASINNLGFVDGVRPLLILLDEAVRIASGYDISQTLVDLRQQVVEIPEPQVIWPTDQEPDAGVRFTAARALGQLSGQAAAEALLQALDDPEPIVRLEARRCLGDALARRPALGETAPLERRVVDRLVKRLETDPGELLPDLVYAAAATGEREGILLALHKALEAGLLVPWVGPDLSQAQLQALAGLPYAVWICMEPDHLARTLKSVGKAPVIVLPGQEQPPELPTVDRPVLLPLEAETGGFSWAHFSTLLPPLSVRQGQTFDERTAASQPDGPAVPRVEFFVGFGVGGPAWMRLTEALNGLPDDVLAAPLLVQPGAGQVVAAWGQRPMLYLDMDTSQALRVLHDLPPETISIELDSLPLYPLALFQYLTVRRYPLVRLKLHNQGDEIVALEMLAGFGEHLPAAPYHLTLPPGQETQEGLLPSLPDTPGAAAATLWLRIDQVWPAEQPSKRPVKKSQARPRPAGQVEMRRQLLLEQSLSIEILPPERFPLAVKSVRGAEIELTDFLAAWVTPQAPGVQALLKEAAQIHPAEVSRQDEIDILVKALFKAFVRAGLTVTPGKIDRSLSLVSTALHLPDQCLALRLASELEAALLFASLLEAAGLEAVVGWGPDSAFAGWNPRPGSVVAPDQRPTGQGYAFLDLRLAGQTSFEGAWGSGERLAARAGPFFGRSLFASEASILISLRSCREQGILPLEGGLRQAVSAPASATLSAVLLGGLTSPDFRQRAMSVQALGESALSDAPLPKVAAQVIAILADMLSDDYPQVRVAAIRALERLQPSGEWRAKLVSECYVPAGEFLMGENEGDPSEQPAHEVNLAAFYLGKYPVTNADYARFMADVGRTFDAPAGKDWHPVIDVDWVDACDYCDWAGMRLPSEAEWEKAASWEPSPSPSSSMGKASRKRRYPWGDNFDPKRCNTSESGVGATTAVGAYAPDGDSPYGCSDMAGNAWEWTSSLYRPYPYDAGDGREDPDSRENRVVRGGAFYRGALVARCVVRHSRRSTKARNNMGFRAAVAPFAIDSDRSEASSPEQVA